MIAGLVTVIIPAYNVERFIVDAVQSALAQTWPHLEVIVVDDGSRDNTLHLLQQIGDTRLSVIRQSHLGSSAARNRGIQEAKGEFVAFLDGDDRWHDCKLQRHLAVFEREARIDLTFSLSRIINEDGDETGRRSQPAEGIVPFRRLLVENIVNNGSAVVLRRTALDRTQYFDETLTSCVDHDMWLRIGLLSGQNIYCIPEYLTMYRMRSGQITRDWRRMELGWSRLMDKMRLLAPVDVAIVEREARGRLYRYLSYIAYEGRSLSESRMLLVRALLAGGLALLGDRRTLVLISALLAATVMPPRLHERLDSAARRARA